MKLLGISGSPRVSNTILLVKEALKGAEEVSGVTTKFISLAEKKIEPCLGCYRVCHQATEEKYCPPLDDDMQEIYESFLEADGIILGTPVYFGGISTQLKTMVDRMSPFGGRRLKNKVGGAIAVGFHRNGGQELACTDILTFYLHWNMILVGTEMPAESVECHYGGCAVTGPDDKEDSATRDPLGMASARNLGRRVAKIAKIIAESTLFKS